MNVVFILLIIIIIFLKFNFSPFNFIPFKKEEWEKLILTKNPYCDASLLWLDPNIEFSKKNHPIEPGWDKEIKQDIINQAIKMPLNYGIIDCGAHIGDGTVPIAHALIKLNRPDITVYAIDPSLYKCEVIKYTAKQNKLTNIVVINCGLSNEISEYYKIPPPTFNKDSIERVNSGGAIWEKTNNSSINYEESIKFNTLDNLVKEHGINNIGIIHLDVEGMEIQALQGGKYIINKSKPYMSLENNGENKNNNNYYHLYYKWIYNKDDNNCLNII